LLPGLLYSCTSAHFCFVNFFVRDTLKSNTCFRAFHRYASPVALPPLSLQDRIASILSAYDDLIENNTRRIRILEEVAQNLYREWFVNFRFPGHENVRMVESGLGLIPEQWETPTFDEVAEFINGFQNVIDAFHIVNSKEIPVKFFVDDRNNGGGITLTDDLFRLKERLQFGNLPHEVEARWRLVETAWELQVNRAALVIGVESESLVVTTGDRRKVLTGCRNALNGYQKGKCFYCFDDIVVDSASSRLADVEHFIPRVLLQRGVNLPLDGVWNLVLACRECNRGTKGKSTLVPQQRLLKRLDTRNEFFIGSHHPLRETLLAQTGKTRQQRIAFLNSVYQSGLDLLIHTWEPQSEREPAF
jgi:hypothetical protein